ncbi:MAG: Peptide/nickel transport system substrate-binding protein, partial [Microbacteriaceae bacterium]|nr:Peptide/nickel transport system substrate-binding protein [Microbacteriaceae bacterium]
MQIRFFTDRPRPGRTALVAVAAIAAASLVLTACSGTSSAVKTTAATDNTALVVASAQIPTVFTNEQTGGQGSSDILEYAINTQAAPVQAVAVKNKTTNQLELSATEFTGLLADSWKISDDGLTYTFKLKHGVKSVAGN